MLQKVSLFQKNKMLNYLKKAETKKIIIIKKQNKNKKIQQFPNTNWSETIGLYANI